MSMSDNELFMLLGFIILLASMVFLYNITRKRKEHFSDIPLRELGAMEQFSNIFYTLFLIYISGYLLIEVIGLAAGMEESITEMFYFARGEERANDFSELRWFYIGLCFTVSCFALFATYNEILLIQRMRDARKKLLLGELPEEGGFSDSAVTPTSSPMPATSIVESNEPATFEAVLQAMDLELKQAVQAAEDLKSKLDETKEKVVTLEIEVQEKDSEIKQIKESKSHFDKMILESSESKDEGDGKSLSITDSVMIGDSVMGGVKIDKQINNDPEAIARAVINAYRMGKSDE